MSSVENWKKDAGEEAEKGSGDKKQTEDAECKKSSELRSASSWKIKSCMVEMPLPMEIQSLYWYFSPGTGSKRPAMRMVRVSQMELTR